MMRIYNLFICINFELNAGEYKINEVFFWEKRLEIKNFSAYHTSSRRSNMFIKQSWAEFVFEIQHTFKIVFQFHIYLKCLFTKKKKLNTAKSFKIEFEIIFKL